MFIFLAMAILSGCGDEPGKPAGIDLQAGSDNALMAQSQIDSSILEPERSADTLLWGRIQYSLPYSARKGKRLFQKYCVVCHGESGGGDGFNAWNLQPPPRDLSDPNYLSALTDERIAEAIREGGPGVQKSNLMPAWGQTFSETEIQQLVAYIRTLPKRE